MLSVDKLDKRYPTRASDLVVLRGVTLMLAAGESIVIMGPSGSGKSTLLNIVGTLETPTAGRVAVEGQDPFALPPRTLARFRNRRIGFVFQEHHLLPQCSALENVLVPTLADASNPDALPRAKELLARVGLSDRMDHRPAELSGGERQRVAIARALINRPGLLLADEPTGNLDRATAETVADLLLELHREARNGDAQHPSGGQVLIVVTHSEKLAERFERRYELVDGRLAQAPQ